MRIISKCVICGDEFYGHGNNAAPLAQGKCCPDCNILVINKRLNNLKNRRLKASVNPFGNNYDLKLACFQGALNLEKYPKRIKSINQAITSANRGIKNIVAEKSSNISSKYQQAFCNKYKEDRKIPHKSNRGTININTKNQDWKQLIFDLKHEE